ncbi:MAG TPA: DUF6049 family protein [Pseudonocardiaceae bacterium]|nr:DUF6049 family protein [Pseudonocardiaceae bacterium]
MRKLAVALFAAASVVLFGPLAPAGVAVADQPSGIGTETSWLRLDVDSITPQVVDSTNGTVSVAATITNVSNRTISHLLGQLRIGAAANSEKAVTDGMAGEVVPNNGTPFTGLADELQPGQHTTITMAVPVSGANSLAITKPGVYPLLINVDGTPDYGKQARLATDSVLLPVRSVPGSSGPDNPGGARPLTLLWPLVDTVPTNLSATATGEPVFTDDHLASSLAAGGRLAGLLDAVRHAPSAVNSALCYAIDPDLLDTVTAMTHPYLVHTATGGTVAGTGTSAATQWLAELRTQVGGHCVLPLPYADADLTALSRSGAVDLEKLAISQEAQLAADLKPAAFAQVNNVLWPVGNAIDAHTMADVAGLGQPLNQTTVLVNPDALNPTTTGTASLTGVSAAAATKAVTVDPLISGALDGSADHSTVAGSPSGTASQGVLDTENGIAALLYQSMFGSTRKAPMLIAPPRRWNVPEAQLQGFLTAVGSALDGAEFATPQSLPGLVGPGPSAGSATLNYPPAAGAEQLPISLTSSVISQDQTQQDLQQAMHADPTNPTHFQPSSLIAPLQLDLLRVSSSAWRGSGNPGGASAAQTSADALSMLTNAVSIEQSPSTIARASSNSPLPVTVNNELPVDVAVRITFSGEPGLQPPPPYNAEIPAHSPLTLFIQAKLTRTGRFSLIETLTTPTGDTSLGSAARLELVSTSYGTIILVVSGVAFGALVLLSARRIYRRARSAKQEQAADHPDDQEVDQAHESNETAATEQEPSNH